MSYSKKVTFKVKEGTPKDFNDVQKKASSKPKYAIDGVSKAMVLEMKTSKSKSQCVVLKEVTYEEAQQNKKHKAVVLLKQFNKLRPQTIDELSTTTKPITKNIKGDNDSE